MKDIAVFTRIQYASVFAEFEPLWDEVKRHLPHGLRRHSDIVVRELQRCLVCKARTAHSQDLNMPPILEQAWRTAILNTELYTAMCTKAFGRVLPHTTAISEHILRQADPNRLAEVTFEHESARIEAMKKAYALVYGSLSLGRMPPPLDLIWAKGKLRATSPPPLDDNVDDALPDVAALPQETATTATPTNSVKKASTSTTTTTTTTDVGIQYDLESLPQEEGEELQDTRPPKVDIPVPPEARIPIQMVSQREVLPQLHPHGRDREVPPNTPPPIEPFRVTVQIHKTGTAHKIWVSAYTMVEELKEIIHYDERLGIPVRDQRLTWHGTELEDGKSMNFYRVRADATIYVLRHGEVQSPRRRGTSVTRRGSSTSDSLMRENEANMMSPRSGYDSYGSPRGGRDEDISVEVVTPKPRDPEMRVHVTMPGIATPATFVVQAKTTIRRLKERVVSYMDAHCQDSGEAPPVVEMLKAYKNGRALAYGTLSDFGIAENDEIEIRKDNVFSDLFT